MTLKVTTRSGAVYELYSLNARLRRDSASIAVHDRRAEDGQWLEWRNPQTPVLIDSRLVLALSSPLAHDGAPFERITTPVVSIEELDS